MLMPTSLGIGLGFTRTEGDSMKRETKRPLLLAVASLSLIIGCPKEIATSVTEENPRPEASAVIQDLGGGLPIGSATLDSVSGHVAKMSYPLDEIVGGTEEVDGFLRADWGMLHTAAAYEKTMKRCWQRTFPGSALKYSWSYRLFAKDEIVICRAQYQTDENVEIHLIFTAE
jgi:hypothetical protein